VIAKSATSTDSPLFVILKYDSASDQYTRAFIYKNADGSWGHRIDNRTDISPRTVVERVYPAKISHVSLSAVPIVTTRVPTAVQTTLSGSAPTVTAISPVYAAKDATISVTITGTNFLSGATAKLSRPGYPSISGTGVSVSSATTIDCAFNLNGADKGRLSVVVTNPDGQSGTLDYAFTIGEAPPIISGVSPARSAINETLSLLINGQNFKEGVKVALTKGSTELVCLNPISTDTTKILCEIDLRMSVGASVGDWDLSVLNIDGQQKGTWTTKFKITNSTYT
jgi:hypothetical protein